jgi:hypothetical protein
MSRFFDENILADTCAHLFHISSSAFDARQQREGIFGCEFRRQSAIPQALNLKLSIPWHICIFDGLLNMSAL